MKKKFKYRNSEAFEKKIKNIVDIHMANFPMATNTYINQSDNLFSNLMIEGYTELEIKIVLKALLEMHRNGALQNLYNLSGNNYIPYPSF